MKRRKKEESVWLGSTQLGSMRVVAISLVKPKPPAFAANMSFHLIPLRNLDALYKIAKRTLLWAEDRGKTRR